MEFLKALFGQGWIGSLIGITGLVIAIILYRASRIGPRPAYKVRALRLIGKEDQALPEEVEILFRGSSVPRLTMTHIILWNSGKGMLDGKNIIADDPLRLEFSEDAEVLRVRVIKVTRESNKFTAKINSGSPNYAICSFDYLDPGDGAVIEILHTDEERYPKPRGTIRGIPKGLLNWGNVLFSRPRPLPFPFKSRRTVYFITLFLAVLIVAVGLIYPQLLEPFVFAKPYRGWFFVIIGLIYVSFPLFMLWITRRRFPKSLVIEDIEG